MAVVLMQSSKGNGLAGPIGGSSVTMAFGVRRASDLLTKSTSVLAVILMIGCIVVNLMVGQDSVDESVIQKNSGQQQQQQLPPTNNVPPTDNNQPPADNNQPPADNNQTPTDLNQPPVDKDNQQKEKAPDKNSKDKQPLGPQ